MKPISSRKIALGCVGIGTWPAVARSCLNLLQADGVRPEPCKGGGVNFRTGGNVAKALFGTFLRLRMSAVLPA